MKNKKSQPLSVQKKKKFNFKNDTNERLRPLVTKHLQIIFLSVPENVCISDHELKLIHHRHTTSLSLSFSEDN